MSIEGVLDEVVVPTSALGWADASEMMKSVVEESRMEAVAGYGQYVQHQNVLSVAQALLARHLR